MSLVLASFPPSPQLHKNKRHHHTLAYKCQNLASFLVEIWSHVSCPFTLRRFSLFISDFLSYYLCYLRHLSRTSRFVPGPGLDSYQWIWSNYWWRNHIYMECVQKLGGSRKVLSALKVTSAFKSWLDATYYSDLCMALLIGHIGGVISPTVFCLWLSWLKR